MSHKKDARLIWVNALSSFTIISLLLCSCCAVMWYLGSESLPHGAIGLSVICDCGILWSYSLAVLSEHSSKSILCIWEHLLFSHVRYMNVVLIDAKAGNIFSGCFRCANGPRREKTCLLGF